MLEVENAARGRTVRIPVGDGDRFAVTSQHSMYDAPVTEEFVVGARGELVLEAVSSPSAAVREYFGLTAAGERHAVVRVMREIVFRVAAGNAAAAPRGRASSARSSSSAPTATGSSLAGARAAGGRALARPRSRSPP